ncbi:hypothetical protein MVLG_02018 [Microbotryum lychnidis-dioicae p1A1 Lamole]|uniref:Uncharacterized protein n=1 Tax=Microbotryum lychnidis-dioicae (strain p1A1 Lamole / MvSl-1064) TaxID=683840 RepID=U5H3W3_USTV1|nr:hypothetical protein MVLG_02018 [Microbotryum lychnidis-dioicae p1A1 Lamole]|eukprot:KDE07746.1 hypothetical protein MVLG_02018 [Microbotryum lychnidis-dioicae p1A1 Lamole]
MLLLWLRVAALALAATGGPVSASPLKALDNALSSLNSTGPASKLTPIPTPPTISLLSKSKTYYPGDTVFFKWDRAAPTMQSADLFIAYSGPLATVPICVTRDMLLQPDRGSMVLHSAYVIPWKELLGQKRATVEGFIYFVYSPTHYRFDTGVTGGKSDSFTIQHR